MSEELPRNHPLQSGRLWRSWSRLAEASNTPVSTTDYEIPMKCQLIKSLRSTVITEATMKRQLKFFVSINENNVQTANTRNDDSFRSYNDNKNDTAGTGD
ncbi:Hypothetical predicted protein, partial [Mytilus galloprovincialis]